MTDNLQTNFPDILNRKLVPDFQVLKYAIVVDSST